MSEITLTGWDVLDEARAMLQAAVAGVPADGWHLPVYLHAAQWTALATVGLLACSFAVAFGLPRRAREQGR